MVIEAQCVPKTALMEPICMKLEIKIGKFLVLFVNIVTMVNTETGTNIILTIIIGKIQLRNLLHHEVCGMVSNLNVIEKYYHDVFSAIKKNVAYIFKGFLG